MHGESASLLPGMSKRLVAATSVYHENIDIGKKPPAEYMADIRRRYLKREGELEKMMSEHSLPEGWEAMAYPKFLEERRKLMAAIIRKGFASLR